MIDRDINSVVIRVDFRGFSILDNNRVEVFKEHEKESRDELLISDLRALEECW